MANTIKKGEIIPRTSTEEGKYRKSGTPRLIQKPCKVTPEMFAYYDESTGAEVYNVPGLGIVDAYDLKEKGYEFVGFEEQK